MTIDAPVEDYLEFVKRKRRPGTWKRYRVVMEHFRTYFKPHALLASIEPAHIDAYRNERLAQHNPWGRPITARNVNSEVAMIRAFYYYPRKFRDQELVHMHWSDLNLPRRILTVRAKPDDGFVPKNWEEREIPLHPELVEIFTTGRRRPSRLVFPRFRGGTNAHLLRMLVRAPARTRRTSSGALANPTRHTTNVRLSGSPVAGAQEARTLCPQARAST